MSTDVLTWANGVFTDAGGEDWASKLQLGGMTAVLFLVVVVLVVLILLLRARHQ